MFIYKQSWYICYKKLGRTGPPVACNAGGYVLHNFGCNQNVF